MRTGVAIIIQDSKGDYLLHLRDENATWMKNEWCLVGGSVEDGENVLAGAKREIYEEIGVNISNLAYFKTIHPLPDLTVFIFNAVINSSEKILLTEGKKIEIFSKDQLVSMLNSLSYTNPYLDVLRDYLDTYK